MNLFTIFNSLFSNASFTLVSYKMQSVFNQWKLGIILTRICRKLLNITTIIILDVYKSNVLGTGTPVQIQLYSCIRIYHVYACYSYWLNKISTCIHVLIHVSRHAWLRTLVGHRYSSCYVRSIIHTVTVYITSLVFGALL